MFWPPSRSGGASLEDRLREKQFEELLHGHRVELQSVQSALDEARGRSPAAFAAAGIAPPLAPDVQRVQAMQCHAAEMRRAEEALAELGSRVAPEWLGGPASSIEHELARRRHAAEVQRLEAALAEARAGGPRAFLSRGLGLEDLQLGAASQPVHFATDARAASPTVAINPATGSAACPRGPASPELAAWPPPSRSPPRPDPAQAWPRQAEVSSSDILVERKRRFGDRLFRLWVEDCADRGGVRVHAMDVQSLCRTHVDLRDCDIQAMFNHFVGRSCDKMARWIAGEAEGGDGSHDRELREFLCCVLDAAYFELDEGGGSLQLRLPALVDPPFPAPMETEKTVIEVTKAPDSPLSKQWIREKLLVPRSVAVERNAAALRSQSQCSSQPSQPRGGSVRSVTSAQKAFPAYAAPPRRPRSTPRSGGDARAGEAAPCGVGSHAGSRRPSSARQAAAAPSCSSRSSLLEMSRLTERSASALSDGNSRQSAQRARPASARESRTACAAVPRPTSGLGGGRAPCGSSQSGKAPPRASEHATDARHWQPNQPRAVASLRSGNGRPPPRGGGDAPLTAESAPRQAACHPPPVEAVAAAARQRPVRPTSAKVSKHKRVADNQDRPTVYEDSEPSDDDEDAFEIEVPLNGGCGPVSLLAPPRPTLSVIEQMANSSGLSSPSAHEPRASSPPPRPRSLA